MRATSKFDRHSALRRQANPCYKGCPPRIIPEDLPAASFAAIFEPHAPPGAGTFCSHSRCGSHAPVQRFLINVLPQLCPLRLRRRQSRQHTARRVTPTAEASGWSWRGRVVPGPDNARVERVGSSVTANCGHRSAWLTGPNCITRHPPRDPSRGILRKRRSSWSWRVLRRLVDVVTLPGITTAASSRTFVEKGRGDPQ
jgi:hypothetical protein